VTALVTGGGTGIGAACARALAAAGHRVVVAGRRREPLEAVAGSLDGALAVVADATDEGDVARLVAAAVAHGEGTLDVLVNNAGGGGGGTVARMPPAAWRAALELNLTSAFLVLQAAVPHLRRARGAVVNVSSVAGLRAGPAVAGYATAKAGLVMLTRQAALDLAPDVRVNAVCPGWVRTPLADAEMDALAAALGCDREAAYAAAVAHVPLRRPATAEEVAAVVAFLASPAAAGITGAALPVDGGSTIVDVAATAFGALG
jgi:NAD(P)-dependent dehydrogenase (short-subunit alcohol dehydrogenase family)